jgi:hypothetical protein
MPNSPAPGALDFYRNRSEIENKFIRNILKTILPDKLDYRPHERSAGQDRRPDRVEGPVCWFDIESSPVREGKER